MYNNENTKAGKGKAITKIPLPLKVIANELNKEHKMESIKWNPMGSRKRGDKKKRRKAKTDHNKRI